MPDDQNSLPLGSDDNIQPSAQDANSNNPPPGGSGGDGPNAPTGPGAMPPRAVGLSLGLMLGTVVVGLAVRFAPLGLPLIVVKYGGSTLWALMVYWIVATLLPSWRFPAVALLTGVLATAVEFVKLYHSPGLDAFRLKLPGAPKAACSCH